MTDHLKALRALRESERAPQSTTPQSTQATTPRLQPSIQQHDNLVHPRETVYFWISCTISVLYYLTFAAAVTQQLAGFMVFVFIVGLILLTSLVMHGYFIGMIKGNGVKITPQQFPEMYETAQQLATRMQLDQMPDMYLMQAGGALNAFATRFAGRNFMILYADIMEMAYAKGEDAVAFVISHEFAHHKRGHTSLWKKILTAPANFIPFLGQAYSRGCEYTCDRYAMAFVPNGAIDGLMALAAGKHLFRQVNIEVFLQNAKADSGFWSWFSEIFSTHPHLINRLKVAYARTQGFRG